MAEADNRPDPVNVNESQDVEESQGGTPRTPAKKSPKRSPGRHRSPRHGSPNPWGPQVSPKDQRLRAARLANGLSSTGKPPKSLVTTASADDLRVIPVRDPYNALSASWTHPKSRKIPSGPPENEDKLLQYSNADYWMKRNKSPKHKEIKAKEEKAERDRREKNFNKQAPGSFGGWAETHAKAKPSHQTKKHLQLREEERKEEQKANEAKLKAQPGPDTASWVEKHGQPKAIIFTKAQLPPPAKFDPSKDEAEARKQREAKLRAKPSPDTMEHIARLMPKEGKKFTVLAQEEAEAQEKARKKRLAAQPPSSAVSWIDEHAVPVERPNVVTRDFPEWGKDPKWKKKKKQ